MTIFGVGEDDTDQGRLAYGQLTSAAERGGSRLVQEVIQCGRIPWLFQAGFASNSRSRGRLDTMIGRHELVDAVEPGMDLLRYSSDDSQPSPEGPR